MSQATSAQAAQVEDWDSDESSAVPNTIVQAQRCQPEPSSRPSQAAAARLSQRRENASDPGCSSRASAPVRSKSQAQHPPAPVLAHPPAHPSATGSPARSKSKPVIHRSDSARGAQRSLTVSGPAAKQFASCSDPNCRDPNCEPLPCREQRFTLPNRQPPRPPPSPTRPYTPSQPYHQYASPPYAAPTPTMMPPPPPPLSRPRTNSLSRAQRPVSFHGYSYDGSHAGPPPAASAYYGHPNYPPPHQVSYLGSTPPTRMLDYPQTSPVPQSPTSPPATAYLGLQSYPGQQLSARHITPSVPSIDVPKRVKGSGLPRTLSARRPDISRVPGAFDDLESSQSDSESVLSDSNSEHDRERQRHRSKSRRRSSRPQEVVTVVHRPSSSRKYYTETAVPIVRTTRVPSRSRDTRRAPSFDTGVDHPSSDINDSDQTARAVIERPVAYSSKSSSRRPSVSTTASSARTKDTSLSSNTDYSRVIIDGPNGRRTAYLSKQQLDHLSQQHRRQKHEERLEKQRLQEERVAAYQKEIAGGDAFELTAEYMKSQHRKSGSHFSNRSHRSSDSGSKASKSDGIKIEANGTILHVYGDTKVEVRPGEDGGPAHFVFGCSSTRENTYRTTSSKSSGSRVGRSAHRSDRIPENEYEDGYEIRR